jgi:hypothetical protein
MAWNTQIIRLPIAVRYASRRELREGEISQPLQAWANDKLRDVVIAVVGRNDGGSTWVALENSYSHDIVSHG